jgi:Na+-driven multidrug efflux pump
MQNNKKKLFNIIMRIMKIRESWINYGFHIFGGIGFLFSVFALAFIFSDKGITSPILMYSMKAFGIWMGIAIFMILAGAILSAIYSNKKNWEKKKHVNKETLF